MSKSKTVRMVQSIFHGSLIIVTSLLIAMVAFIVWATYFPPEARIIVVQGAHGVIPENFPMKPKPPTPPLGICTAAGGEQLGDTSR